MCSRGIAPAVGDTGTVQVFLKESCPDTYDYDFCTDSITVEQTFTHGPDNTVEVVVQ